MFIMLRQIVRTFWHLFRLQGSWLAREGWGGVALLQMELYADRRRLHVSLRLQAFAASKQGLQGFPASEQGLTFDKDESKRGREMNI